MSTATQRLIDGYRFAQTRRGDTLQAIAARELSDGTRWPELIGFNGLVPPFITDDPAQARNGVLLTGSIIRLPAATAVADVNTDPDLVFERDVDLGGGAIGIVNGDFAVASGLDNLKQAIRHRVETEQGDLIFHPDYGSLLRRLIGAVNGPTAALLAASYARSAVERDPRVRAVVDATAVVAGDTISVTVVAEPIVGRRIEIDLTV